jgi:PAS domain S-box-containing protein
MPGDWSKSKAELIAELERLRAGAPWSAYGGPGGEGLVLGVFDALQDGLFVLAPDYTILKANRWLEQRFRQRGPLAGRLCYQALQDRDCECEWCPLPEALGQAGVVTREVPLWDQGRQQGWLQVAAHPVRDPADGASVVVMHLKDVTQEKMAQLNKERKSVELARSHQELMRLKEVLKASRNKLKAVFDSLEAPVYSLNPEGRVESVNLACAGLAGRHPRELVGLDNSELLEMVEPRLPVGRACREAYLQAREQDRPQRRLAVVEDGQGTSYFELHHTPVRDQDGGLSLMIVQIVDVTTFKRMEHTIRQYSHSLEAMVAARTAELTQANQELKRLDQLRQDLFNMMVHDMKGPLAELMGNLDLLSYGELAEDQREVLDLASLGAEDLLRMILNLLDINRLEEEALQASPEELSFGALATEVVSKFATMIRLKGLAVEVADRLAGGFAGDPELLGRVLQNLLTNALHHTEEGGRIELGAQRRDGGVDLWVSDDGPGISPERQQIIFQKFTQAGHGGPRTSTGLGLTFCQLAARAHGGDIRVQSRPGQGATFLVWLPQNAGAEGAAGEAEGA